MAKSAALVQSNSQVYRVYSRRLANPADQDIFIITANKLSAFLSDSRAYYAEAQRSIVDVLEIARGSLKNVAPSVFSKPGFLDRSAISPDEASLFDAFDKLANSVTPYISLFADESLQNRLVLLLLSIGVSLPQEVTNVPPPNPPNQIYATPSTGHQADLHASQAESASPIGPVSPGIVDLTLGSLSALKGPTTLSTPAPDRVPSSEVKGNDSGAVAQPTSSRQATQSPVGESHRLSPPSQAPVSGDVAQHPATTTQASSGAVPSPSTKINPAAATALPTSVTTDGPAAQTLMPTVPAAARAPPAPTPPLIGTPHPHAPATTSSVSNTTSQLQKTQMPSPGLVHRDLRQGIRTTSTSPRMLRITDHALLPAPEPGSSSAPMIIDEDVADSMSTPADETAMVIDDQDVQGSKDDTGDDRKPQHDQEGRTLTEQQNASVPQVASHRLVSDHVPSATGTSGAGVILAQSSSAPSTSTPFSDFATPLSATPLSGPGPSSLSASLCDKPSGTEQAKDGKEQGKTAEVSVEGLVQPRRGIPTPQQNFISSATPRSNLTNFPTHVSANGLPPNGMLEQINGAPPQQSPEFTPPPSRQPTQHNGLSRIQTSPDTVHPTLSCWIKNMNKLSSLIDRLQELADAAPAEHRSQLLRQVVALRTTFKKQREHCMEFLTLSDEYANKYLLDISDKIQRQSSFLDKLEERLGAAKELRREAVELQMFYESETVATMKKFRATALPRPLPEDRALFSEVELVLAEIRQCYMDLDKFWTEEISRAFEALEMRRVDPTDFERWKNFHANLEQTIESWKDELPSGDVQILRRNNTSSSKEADIGAIASSMSSAVGSLTSALERVTSSNSLKYLRSDVGLSLMQRVYEAFAANSDLSFSFLQKCADYGGKAIGWRLPPTALPTSLRVMASHDLRERTMRLRSEMNSVENAASVQGPRRFKAAYNKALSLEQKMTSGLKILLEKWVIVTDGHNHPDDVLPDVITLEQVREQWEKAGYSVRAALAVLKNELAPQVFFRSAPLASTRLQSVVKRCLTKLVCFLRTMT